MSHACSFRHHTARAEALRTDDADAELAPPLAGLLAGILLSIPLWAAIIATARLLWSAAG